MFNLIYVCLTMFSLISCVYYNFNINLAMFNLGDYFNHIYLK
jgi:hypothetical protein